MLLCYRFHPLPVDILVSVLNLYPMNVIKMLLREERRARMSYKAEDKVTG